MPFNISAGFGTGTGYAVHPYIPNCNKIMWHFRGGSRYHVITEVFCWLCLHSWEARTRRYMQSRCGPVWW